MQGKKPQPATQDPIQNPLTATGFEQDLDTLHEGTRKPGEARTGFEAGSLSAVTSHRAAASHSTRGCKCF